MQELIDPPRGDAVAVPFRMDMNIDDIPELLSSIAVVQEKITKDHTHRPGTVLARVSAFVSTAKHYDIAQNICSEETLRQKVKKRKQKTYLCRWCVMRLNQCAEYIYTVQYIK